MPSIVRDASAAPVVTVGNARGATIQVLVGPDDGAPHFFTRMFTLEPGARIPAHRHDAIEHEQFMVEGEMVLGLDDDTHTISAGQAVFIPARVVHWYENRTDAPARFLCIVPRTDDYQTEWLETL